MYEIGYIDPSGHDWELTSRGRSSGVFIAEDGIDGFIGQAEDSTSESIDVAGQLLNSVKIKPWTATLEVLLVPSPDQHRHDLFKRWRKAWSRTATGTIRITTADLGNLYSTVRLSELIPPPKINPFVSEFAVAQTPIIGDEGVWWTARKKDSGMVNITNPGHVPIWPTITWAGSGGRVTLPSGATFTLPATNAPRTINLNPAESFIVTDSTGNTDTDLWHTLATTAWAEPITPQHTAQFQLPPDATIHWRIGFLDPWQ